MVNIVRDNRNYQAIQYHRKILPLLSFGILLVILGQQVFFSHSVQATHIDQGLSGRLRQRELAQQRMEAEKRKKSKKSKSRKSSSSSKSAKSERKMSAQPQPQESTQQPAQQDSQTQAAQDARQEQPEVQQQPVQQQVVQEQADVQQQQYQQQQQQQQAVAQQQTVQQQQVEQQPAEAPVETFEREEKFKPKTQSKFVPSMERQHRSPLQLPDVSVTGEEVHVETVDDISRASQSDMSAYSQVIALDDEAQAKLLQEMEPKPVNAEEDTGGMAQFMLDVSQQSQGLPGDKQEVVVEQTPQVEDDDEAKTGADFAAQLAQKYEAQQKEREAGRGVAEKIANSWYQNSNPAPSSNVQLQSNSQQPSQLQMQTMPEDQSNNPINLENLEIDY